MKPRIIFIHGNQTANWAHAWTPWLKLELTKRRYKTDFQTFPDSMVARAKIWLPFLRDDIKAGKNDVLLGWSSGAVAAMRCAETNKIRGSILVSPSITDLNNWLEKRSGYFKKPWDWGKIRSNQEKIALFYSDNDPYIPQKEFTTIAKKLAPAVFKIHKAGHFLEQDTFPELLEYIVSVYK